MGSWGPRLYQDDIAQDVKCDYKEILQKGETNEEAINKILLKYSEEINDYDEGPVFWMIFADILWEYGRLTKEIKEKALIEIDKGNNLKKWQEEGTKSEFEIRKQELLKLKEKLNLPMPIEKKIEKNRSYKCDWKVGDTFAYKLESNFVKGTQFEGQYFIIRKVDEGTWYPEHIIPIVYVQITKNAKVPESKEDLNKLEYIPMIKYLPERNKVGYRMKLLNTSKRIIPKKLIYIGNFQGVNTPSNEYNQLDTRNIFACTWKQIEETLIKRYIELNDI